MCNLLNVSRSGYYAWKSGPECQRKQTDRMLSSLIEQIYEQNKGIYGAVKIREELRERGHHFGRHKIAKLLRISGLKGCPQRRYNQVKSSQFFRLKANNLLDQHFTVEEPN